MASNLRYAQKLVQSGFVRWQTLERASRHLNDSRVSKSKKIESLLTIGFEFAGHVLNNYWLLKPHVSRRIDEFVHTTAFEAYFVIGLQIRQEFLDAHEIELFVECALEIEAHESMQRRVKWFVASDDENVLAKLRAKYHERMIVGHGRIGHVAFDKGSNERAVFDLELLSRCQEVVVTGGSTFGFVSSIKSQKLPYVVEGKKNRTGCRRFELFAPPISPIYNAATF